jgi:hypothetical protein
MNSGKHGSWLRVAPFLVLLLGFGALAVWACDDTGPSPIGVQAPDDSGASTDSSAEGGEGGTDGSTDGSAEGGGDAGDGGTTDDADAADASDAD